MDQSTKTQDLSSLERSHPRRRPAAQSVSLVRKSATPPPPTDSEENGSSASSMQVDAASDIVEKPACQKDSSGESSNPEKWFEKSNSKIKTSNASFVDDDPPFFLRNSSSETTPPDIIQQREREQRENSGFVEPSNDSGFLAPETNASDEFRSVIDDLTIENKKLKKRLKKYERNQKTMLYPEALFELRVHGLPSEKKRDLEKLLQDFVGKMGKSPIANLTSASGSAVPSSLLAELQSSSHSRIQDSGYVSMSLSGQNSSNRSGQDLNKPTDPSDAERKQDIQDYLSDIPTGLLPRRSGPLTDREKRKIVVRKIEQIFAGRDPATLGHQQSIQQQHVAQSAARADRRATEASGTTFPSEGSREARIMPKLEGSNFKKDSSNDDSMTGSAQDSMEDDSGIIEQRPTRPLDLDPSRAQVPDENMQYLRHLGFSPPHQSMSPQPDGHGWIHLNVLTNLAQTHFEHVTQDFVRKAIADSSKMLELSSDGRKVRWKGGKGVTSSSNSPSNDDVAKSISSGKPSTQWGSVPPKLSSSSNSRHKLTYSPLFQREDSEMEDVVEDELAYDQSHGPGPSSALASPKKAIATLNETNDDAPIIFYQNPHFYTDMSRDRGGGSGNRKSTAYLRVPTDPVGASTSPARSDLYRKLEYEKGPLSQPAPRVEIASNSSSDKPLQVRYQGNDLLVIARSGGTSSASSHTPDPIDFEASGIGGVVPADNFSISVRSRQNADLPKPSDESSSGGRRSRNYAPKIRKLLRESRLSSVSSPADSQQGEKSRTSSSRRPLVVQREIIGSKRLELPASQLPDAVFLHDSSEEEEEDEDDEMDYESDSDGTSESNVPHSAPQRMDWALISNVVSGQSSPSDAGNIARVGRKRRPNSSPVEKTESEARGSDESIDLLQNARAVAPEAVRAQEREFESNIAERIADDIPPGSSAATAEGGSGFNSPALTPGGAAHNPQSGTMLPPTSRLKRPRKMDDTSEARGTRSTKSPKME